MSRFPTTRWSIVLGAGSTDITARAALEKLCRTYRAPVLAYVRRQVRDADLAEDYTQAFFARLIENDTTTVADPARGRFRTWLLVAVQRFVGHELERARATKRGGGVGHVDLDDPVVMAGAAASGASPEQAFDRDWALALVQAALARLREEAATAGKLALYERLREFVVERPDDADYDVSPMNSTCAATRLRSPSIGCARACANWCGSSSPRPSSVRRRSRPSLRP